MRSDDNILDTLTRERKLYVEKWTVSAAHYQRMGYYDWMADYVLEHLRRRRRRRDADGHRRWRILELGVGTGRSTYSLAWRGCTVVGIDENPQILKAATSFLEEERIDTTLFLREKQKAVLGQWDDRDWYSVMYREVQNEVPASQVTLLEGDVFLDARTGAWSDEKLIEWLGSQEPFDAVVCWLPGSHAARGNNFSVGLVRSTRQYSQCVQLIASNIAEKILKPRGILNIVIRTNRIPREKHTQFISEYEALHPGMPLDIESVDQLPMKDPPHGGMEHTTEAGQPLSDHFTSLISIKPRRRRRG